MYSGMAQMYGLYPSSPANGDGSQALNVAGALVCFSFIARQTGTITVGRAYLSAVAGTDANRKIKASIYSVDSSGVPTTLVGTAQERTGSFATGVQEWTSISASVTKGVQYWLVFENTSVAPGTDYVTFRVSSAGNHSYTDSYISFYKYYNGSSWTTSAGPRGLFQIQYSDNTLQNIFFIADGAIADSVYGTKESGAIIQTPSTWINIAGIAIGGTTKSGTPTDRCVRIYDASLGLLLSTTTPIATSDVTTKVIPLDRTIQAAPNSTIYVVIADLGGVDSSSNYTRLRYAALNNTAANIAMKTVNTSYVYRASTGVSFTVYSDRLPYVALVLDSTNPFPNPPINRRTSTGR